MASEKSKPLKGCPFNDFRPCKSRGCMLWIKFTADIPQPGTDKIAVPQELTSEACVFLLAGGEFHLLNRRLSPVVDFLFEHLDEIGSLLKSRQKGR